MPITGIGIVHISSGVGAFFAAGCLLFRRITLDGAEHSLQDRVRFLVLQDLSAGTGMAGQPDLAVDPRRSLLASLRHPFGRGQVDLLGVSQG